MHHGSSVLCHQLGQAVRPLVGLVTSEGGGRDEGRVLPWGGVPVRMHVRDAGSPPPPTGVTPPPWACSM